jgi:hypothetical protein
MNSKLWKWFYGNKYNVINNEINDKNIIIKNKIIILTIIEMFIIILLSFLLYIEKNKNYYELILNNTKINNNRNISLSYEYTGLVDIGKYTKEDIEWDLMFSNMPLRIIYNDSNSVIDINKYVKSDYQEIYTQKKYHFLHCINVLRKFLRTVQNGVVIHKEEMQTWHLNHCVKYLKNVSEWDIYDKWGVKIPKPDGSF